MGYFWNELEVNTYYTYLYTWERCELGKLASLITKGTTPLDKSWVGSVNYVKTESINQITGDIANKTNTSIEEHEGHLKRSQLKENDILFSIVGTLGRVGIVKGKNLPANTNQQIAIIRLECLNTGFILNTLKSSKVQSFIKSDSTIGAQPSLSLWQINGLKINFPNIEEQTKIGNLFGEVDNLIALHQRKLEQLSLLKQAYLQKVYPEQEHKVPKLRFANFQEDWKQRKLGSVTERITRKNKKLESTLPLTISAQYGLVDQETFFKKIVASKDVSGYFLLMNGEFAYNKSYSKDYPWGAVKRLDLYDKGVLSTLYITFKPIKVDSNFLIHYYDTTKWHKEVAIRAAEGARNHGLLNITAADFFDTNLPIPEADQEQYKIGMLFKQLDETITLHQQKLEKLQTLKKAYLQKMFI